MKKKKKFLAFIMAAVISIGCFASGLFSASALTQKIILDTEIINSTSGVYDKNWYYFTPEQTGIYTFLSFNRLARSEAYLFIKEGTTYTQLDYSNKSPNFEYYSQPNENQFCLSHKLEAGKTYYYAAGWDSSTNTGSTMAVKLIYEGSDEDIIEGIEVSCNAELSWYTDGSWERDSQGEAYFSYNYSKIIQNMVVKLNYKNGSSSTAAAGAETIDGYSIRYTQNQSVSHWYPQEDEKYTGNYITVSVLDKKAQYDVKINQDALFTVSCKVCDWADISEVSGATVLVNGSEITTDSKGEFSFVATPGVYSAKISGKNIIPRTVTIMVDVNSEKNNHTDNPILIVRSDYVEDGIINAKDYGFILSNFTGEKRETEAAKISGEINFTANDYK